MKTKAIRVSMGSKLVDIGIMNSTDTKQRISLSAASQVVSQIVVGLLAVVILKLTTKQLGVHDYGIYATAMVFVTTFSLLTDLGLNAIATREIAKYPNDAEEIINNNLGLRVLLCIVIIPIIIGAGYALYGWAPPSLKLCIALLSTYLIFDAIRAVTLSYFTAKVRNDITALINVLQQISFLVLILIAVSAGANIYGFISAYVVANVIGAIMAVYATRRKLNLKPRVEISYSKKIIAMSLSLGVIQVFNLIYLKADSLLLSTIKSPVEVGVYGIAYTLVLAFLTLPGIIMTALMPSMATASTNARLESIVNKAYSYMIILACLLVIGGFIIRQNIILTVSGPSFVAAATPFAVLCFASAFSYLNNVFGFASLSVNKHHKMILVSVGSLLLNVTLNLLLIPKYSVNGAAWATAISEVIAFALVYAVFVKETDIRVRLMRHSYKPILAATGSLAICTLIHSLWNTHSPLLNTLISGFVVSTFYTMLLFVLRGLPKEVLDIVEKIINRIVRH